MTTRDRPGAALRAALAVVGDEGQHEEHDEEQHRREDDDVTLRPLRQQRQHAEVPEEVPVRPRIGVDDRGVGRLAQFRRADDDRQQDDDDDNQHAEDGVAPGGVGPERHAVPLQQRVVLGAVGLRVHRIARFRRLRDAVVDDEIEVQRDRREDQRRDEEDVDGEEAAERRAADRVAREDEVRHPLADERQAARLLRRDDERPEAV